VPWFLRRALDGIRSGAPSASIWLLAAAMLGVSLVGGVGRFWMRQLLNGVSRWIEFDLRNDLFRQLESVDATFYTRMRTGDLMARLTNDLSAVRMAVGPAIMYLTSTIAGGGFALAFMIHLSPRLTLMAAVPMALLPALGILMGRQIHARFEAVQSHFSDLTTLAQENLAGVRVVRAFRQEDAEIARFDALNDGCLEKNMRLARLYGLMQPAFSIFAGLGMVGVIWFGGALVVAGTISVGNRRIRHVSRDAHPAADRAGLGDQSVSARRRIHDAPPRYSRRPLGARRNGAPSRASAAGRSYIRVWNVGFRTTDRAAPRWVLRGVSFTAPAGATIGVVGATASGKSALMDLVPRLFDPQEGEILLDNVPIRDLDHATLRREICYVTQESFLFSDTIGSNLSYGTSDERDGEWAARIAQLDETIKQFPGGYSTLLGERGINLSGGQKQRAALARALARRPSIVLLDDALSAVDTHTEAEILRSLRDTLSGRTALIASHRVRRF
jgi:ATP-binding cassette subfamily B protein